MRPGSQTPTRKDQARNRQALVEAARTAFVEQGPAINLGQVARRAGVASSTLYRHFATKDDLVETVLDDMVRPVAVALERAAAIQDPWDAFRLMFTECCVLTETEVATFARLASVSSRTFEHAHRLVVALVEPATTRLQAAGGLRDDLTVDDVAMFAQMVEGAHSPAQRRKALQVLLAGMCRPPRADRHRIRSVRRSPTSAQSTAADPSGGSTPTEPGP